MGLYYFRSQQQYGDRAGKWKLHLLHRAKKPTGLNHERIKMHLRPNFFCTMPWVPRTTTKAFRGVVNGSREYPGAGSLPPRRGWCSPAAGPGRAGAGAACCGTRRARSAGRVPRRPGPAPTAAARRCRTAAAAPTATSLRARPGHRLSAGHRHRAPPQCPPPLRPLLGLPPTDHSLQPPGSGFTHPPPPRHRAGTCGVLDRQRHRGAVRGPGHVQPVPGHVPLVPRRPGRRHLPTAHGEPQRGRHHPGGPAGRVAGRTKSSRGGAFMARGLALMRCITLCHKREGK